MSFVHDEFGPSIIRDFCHLAFESLMLGAETQAVIAMRLMGLSGFWRVAPDEHSRMVLEKPVSFAAATSAAVAAASAGQRADKIIVAAIDPLRDKTSANMRRLSKSGPRILPFT